MPRKLWAGMISLAIVAAVAPIRAQGPSDRGGVSVTASGEVTAKPNAVEIDVIVAHADIGAADALAKYGEAKQRLLDACGKLKLATLSIEERAIDVTVEPLGAPGGVQVFAAPDGAWAPPAVAPGDVGAPNSSEIKFARTIRLTLRGIRDKPEAEVLATIGTILDTVRDAGGVVGPPPREFGISVSYPEDGSQKAICRFVLEDAEELHKKAVEAALAQAKREAGILAGGRVGALTAISTSNTPSGPWPVLVAGSNPENPKPRPTSSRFMEIPVRVTVHATFRIE